MGGSARLISEGWTRTPRVEREPQASQAEGQRQGVTDGREARVSGAEGSVAAVLSRGHRPLAAPVWSVVCPVRFLPSCDPELLLYFLSEDS